MNVAVDRVRPIQDQYKEVKYLIRFSWLTNNDAVPTSAHIEFEPANSTGPLPVAPHRPWIDFEDAVEYAKNYARSYIDKIK